MANSNRLKKAKNIGMKLIQENPFDLGTLIYLSMCLGKLEGNTENKYYLRMKAIVQSILYTGDGNTSESSIKISNIGDDGLLVGFLGFNGKRIEDSNIDGKMFSLWESSSGRKLYFEYVFIFL
ncbi:DUF4919 domain-containing protein [Bernardetia sp. MNP-M8]